MLSPLFARLAASTIAIQFAMQSGINLAVNLNLIPPKGMTLPFVSYGGTSMIAVGRSGASGTSTAPSGAEGCAKRRGQYAVLPLGSPGPPMSPARTMALRSPNSARTASSHATFAAP